MKEIPLSRGLKAIIDDDDFERVNAFKWNAQNPYKGLFYAARNDYSAGRPNRKLIMMHRFILGITDRKVMVDHINRNSLDNRKENLRTCTNSQNQGNSRLYRSNTSGFRGVRLSKWGWAANITKKSRHVSLGIFKTKEEAAKAYDKAALDYWGPFASLNFPRLASLSTPGGADIDKERKDNL